MCTKTTRVFTGTVYNGILYKKTNQDWYQVPSTKGEWYRYHTVMYDAGMGVTRGTVLLSNFMKKNKMYHLKIWRVTFRTSWGSARLKTGVVVLRLSTTVYDTGMGDDFGELPFKVRGSSICKNKASPPNLESYLSDFKGYW